MININNINPLCSFPGMRHYVNLKNSELGSIFGFYSLNTSPNHLESHLTCEVEKLERLEQTLNENRFQIVLDVVYDTFMEPFARFETKIEILRTRIHKVSGFRPGANIEIYFKRLSQIGDIYIPPNKIYV